MNEKDLHISFCTYIKAQYPNVIFTSDLSGIRLTMGQSVQVKKMRSSNGIPDVLIFEPRGKWHGLFIELKREGEKLYKKDGSFKSEHIKMQSEMRLKLTKLGYFTNFAIGFDEAKSLMDWYMNLI